MLNKYNVYIYSDESNNVPIKSYIGCCHREMLGKVTAAAELDLLILIEKAIVQDERTGIKTGEEDEANGASV